MRFLFLIIISFLLLSCIESGPDTIVWDGNKPLTWDDFQGKPAHRFAASSTNYDIVKSVNKKDKSTVTVEIKAVFYTKKSWKKGSWVNEQVLAHEQKHFDIVELYARKLRKQITSFGYQSYQDVADKIDSLYTENDKAMDVYQDKYDDETDGSMNGDMQRQWSSNIINEIKLLDEYKNVSFELTLK
jgi:hypothetical protein